MRGASSIPRPVRRPILALTIETDHGKFCYELDKKGRLIRSGDNKKGFAWADPETGTTGYSTLDGEIATVQHGSSSDMFDFDRYPDLELWNLDEE
jgi:hypothetical protein